MHSKHYMSHHRTGIILVTLSAVVFSTAGVFTKGVDSGAWEIIFWRGVFATGFTTTYVLWRGLFRQEFVLMGKSGWAVAIIGASGTAAFIPAFKLTTMANVMMIYAAAPLIAALLAWFWIKERISFRVGAGCIGAFASVTLAEGMKRIPAGETALRQCSGNTAGTTVWLDVLCRGSGWCIVSGWGCHFNLGTGNTG